MCGLFSGIMIEDLKDEFDFEKKQVVEWIINETKINGYYLKDTGYCTKTEGRNEKEVVRTMMHEHCHYLINEQFEHFCS